MGIVSDQLGDLPAKSRELLKQAVDSGVAAELEQRIRAGMDSDSAVQSVASWLITTTPNDAEGCTWVTREFARALGYETTFGAEPAEEPGESATMGDAATQMAGSPYRPGDQATVGGAPIRQPQVLPAAREARSRNVPIAAASVAADCRCRCDRRAHAQVPYAVTTVDHDNHGAAHHHDDNHDTSSDRIAGQAATQRCRSVGLQRHQSTHRVSGGCRLRCVLAEQPLRWESVRLPIGFRSRLRNEFQRLQY